MPHVLHFYQGAVTRADYWDMPGDERNALLRYREAYLKQVHGGR